jgi:hypothetical protein
VYIRRIKVDTIVRAVGVALTIALPAVVAVAGDASAPAKQAETAPAETAEGAAPALRGFMDRVAHQSPAFHRDNYRDHNGTRSGPAGFSVDVRLTGHKRDERGFYPPADAVAFLLAVDRTAATTGARWRALYNDAEVAGAVAKRARRGSVQFMGQTQVGKTDMLNYHGPDPLKLHIHLDVSWVTGSGP